ncbi:MAG: glucosaminidase domain-containing protein [Phaeodactylibacter sp.]|nr:glucosaminidase domain-containing protein [Phaeodactylibacter sp.]MCB9291806.1 glucosaminidase domain-containing protein [Lewinellaceae bacterium]
MIIKLPFVRSKLEQFRQWGTDWLERHWLKLLAAAFVCFLMLERNLTLELRLSTSKPYVNLSGEHPASTPQATAATTRLQGEGKAIFAGGDSEKRDRQMAYVRRFAKVAQAEMEKYGIPASVKLAQGLLESDAGKSPIARQNNNHFGIKCFSRNCRKGHCSNFQDDTHKDFFRIYPSAWESFRAHSLMLKQNERYQPLFSLPATDYRAWAQGLSEAGYATDPDYSEKVVRLIEELDLQRFDGA